MSLAASKLQQRRRDQDRVFHETQSFLDQHHSTRRLHDWESRTQNQIEQREVDAITQRLLKEDQEDLHQRKQEVQSLYRNEMSRWKENLQSSLEVTQEQKMEQIRSRAYELKAKREAERQEFVKTCYERQWRDACDDLRAFDSKVTLDRIVKDRQSMIESKKKIDVEMQRQLQNNDRGTDALSLIRKDESDEQAQRRQSSLEFKKALDHQMEWKKSRDAAATIETQLEEREQLRKLAFLEQRAKENAKQEIERNKLRGRDTLRDSRLRAEHKEEQRRMERDQNMILLQHALDMEHSRVEAERAKQKEGREATSGYAQSVQEQAKIDEKENENVNRIREDTQRRISKLNDDKIQAEAELRRRCTEEVNISRKEQIRMKQLEERALRREMDQHAEDIKTSLLQAEEAERRDAEKAQFLRMETMLANKATMDERSREREKEQQEKFLFQKQIHNEQTVYQQRVEEQKKRGCGVSDLI